MTNDRLGPSLKLKIAVVEEIPEWEDILSNPEHLYPMTAKCGKCKNQVTLNQNNPVTWQAEGSLDLYLGKFPGYPCKPCGVINFPPSVLDELAGFAVHAAKQFDISPTQLKQPYKFLPLS